MCPGGRLPSLAAQGSHVGGEVVAGQPVGADGGAHHHAAADGAGALGLGRLRSAGAGLQGNWEV